MDKNDLMKKLSSLAQLDRDAVSVYDEAIKHVEDDDVLMKFKEFQAQHDYHAKSLVLAIEKRGGVPPELDLDFMGRMADWVTNLRSRRGTEGALHAMKSAEDYHNKRYTETHGWDTGDAELHDMLEQFHGDEKMHLDYVEQRLNALTGSRR
jgi:rubrerythrin